MTCEACNRVLDEPSTFGPTAAVVLRASHSGSKGAVEIYRCEGCGTQWQRFKPAVTSPGRNEPGPSRRNDASPDRPTILSLAQMQEDPLPWSLPIREGWPATSKRLQRSHSILSWIR
jgi:hypothetical protein